MSGNKKDRVVTAALGYTIGDCLIKGLTFLTIPIFARLMSAESYGIYNLYMSYEMILCHLIGLALYMSLKNAKIRLDEEKYQAYASSILLLMVFNMLIFLVIVSIFARSLQNLLDLSDYLIITLVIHSFCSSVLTFYNVHLSVRYSYKSYLVVGAINAVGNITLSVLFIYIINDSKQYIGRVYGTVIPLVVIAMYIIIYFWRKNRPTINKEYWRYGMKYSLPLVPHALSQVVLGQFDRVMINKMIGATSAGIYSFAYNIYTIIAVVTSAMDKVWGTWFFEKMKDNQVDLIKERSTDYVIGVMLFVLTVISISPELIKVLGTSEYSDSVYVVIPLVVSGFFAFLYTLPAQVEYYFEKTKVIAIGTVLAALLNIILNYMFIQKFGYMAAAYTTEATYIIYFVLHYLFAKKISEQNLFDGVKLIMSGIIIASFGIVVIFMIDFVWIRWMIAMILGIALAFFLNNKLNIVDKIYKRSQR